MYIIVSGRDWERACEDAEGVAAEPRRRGSGAMLFATEGAAGRAVAAGRTGVMGACVVTAGGEGASSAAAEPTAAWDGAAAVEAAVETTGGGAAAVLETTGEGAAVGGRRSTHCTP